MLEGFEYMEQKAWDERGSGDPKDMLITLADAIEGGQMIYLKAILNGIEIGQAGGDVKGLVETWKIELAERIKQATSP